MANERYGLSLHQHFVEIEENVSGNRQGRQILDCPALRGGADRVGGHFFGKLGILEVLPHLFEQPNQAIGFTGLGISGQANFKTPWQSILPVTRPKSSSYGRELGTLPRRPDHSL